METLQTFLPGYYRDSVALMQLSAKLASQPGVAFASAQMATAANIDLMVGTGLLATAPAARPNDLLVVVQAATAAEGTAALEFAQATLDEKKAVAEGSATREPPRSVTMALAQQPDSNVVLISTPGEFAGAEAMKALHQGLNVMMFSDNVPGWQEVELKTYARDHDLLVMGPDCGTSILGGVPLAFANVVTPGPIGVVGASGTGIQQVTCLIDSLGQGISHAIGTGGHDLSQEVGGITMLSALGLFAADEKTKVIVLLSKPPAESVAARILEEAQKVTKPIVICFLGDEIRPARGKLTFAPTLEQAAVLAVGLLTGQRTKAGPERGDSDRALLEGRHAAGFVRGLFTGGTFCYEAQILLQPFLGEVFSNTPTKGVQKLPDLWKSQGHTLIDLGDDDFTRGKPHPMIDPSTRNDRLLQEAKDPQTGLILLDLVLGYGAHENPAAGLVEVIARSRAVAQAEGRKLEFVGFVCGTDKDPQNLAQQRAALSGAGVFVAESNAHAAELVRQLVAGSQA